MPCAPPKSSFPFCRRLAGPAEAHAALHHPDANLRAGAQAQLAQDVLDMVLSSSIGDDERLGDLMIGSPLSDESRDLQLAATQRVAVAATQRCSRGVAGECE